MDSNGTPSINTIENKPLIWIEILSMMKKKHSWDKFILFLEQNSSNEIGPEKYIETIYFLLNTLIYGQYESTSEHDKIAQTLKAIFDKSYKSYNKNAEYLFFVGYLMALASWYFGQNDLELSHKMLRTSTEIEPDNILYQWAYRFSISDPLAKNLSKQLTLDSDEIKWLNSKGDAGKYIVSIIRSNLESR